MRADDFPLMIFTFAAFTTLRSGTKRVRSGARGEVQPGAERHELRARRKRGATALLPYQPGRAGGNDERRAGAKSARLPCQFPPVGPGAWPTLT